MTFQEKVRGVRKKFENGEVPDSTLIDLYAKYADIENPTLFVRRAKRLFPKGNCGLASLYLKEILGMGELIQGTYERKPHTFLMVGEEVVDITADQYGGPEVYVGPLVAPWSDASSVVSKNCILTA